MSVEELMKPRYKVIADYPDSPFSIGTIYNYNVVDEELRNIEAQPTFHTIHGIERYPHLFKKLEWWQERKKEEMPKYIKAKRNGEVAVAEKWHISKDENGVGTYASVGRYCWFVTGHEPATEQEYTDYINSLAK